jgi:hypothetical protein
VGRHTGQVSLDAQLAMQLTNAQKVIALQEMLEMLAAHPEGLSTGDLLQAKSFRNRRELTAKQVEELLSRVPGVYQQPSKRIKDGEWVPATAVPRGWENIRMDEIGVVDYATLWKLEKANG